MTYIAPTAEELAPFVNDGYIRATRHEDLPYTIYNYSHATQYGHHWTPETMTARGLILSDSGEIITLGMPKFFNAFEPNESGIPTEPQSGKFEVLTKLDGWLGLTYRDDDENIVWCTRGSFASLGAVAANEMWRARYSQFDKLLCSELSSLTLMAEIIHSSTRIVCTYPSDELVLIAARDRFTGESLSHKNLRTIAGILNMPYVDQIPLNDFTEVIQACQNLPTNTEGFVLHWPETGFRLKLKTESYVAMNKLLMNHARNVRSVREAWRDEDTTTLDMLCDGPEFLKQIVQETVQDMNQRLGALMGLIEVYVKHAFNHANKDRRAYALWVELNVPQPYRYLVHAGWFGKYTTHRQGREISMFRKAVFDMPTHGGSDLELPEDMSL